MWDDIIIGSDPRGKGTMSVHVFDLIGRGHISESARAFWISGAYLNTGMTIFKNTREGRELEKLISTTEPRQKTVGPEIMDFMERIVVKNLTHEKLVEKITALCQEHFEAGRSYQAGVLREALMMQG